MDKFLLQRQVLERLAEDLLQVEQAARAAHETTTHEENISDLLVSRCWRTRPLVIVVPASNDRLLAQFELSLRNETVRAAFSEREMVLYTVVAGAGRREQQSLSPSQTHGLLDAVGVHASSPGTVILFGKDGGVKVRKHGNVSIEELFVTIDQLPMRQR